ncbi:MAG: DUF1934 domain-containing protein [Ruminococcaceae bacterium]|nr:DUF1934 domain-containing protein [Oscillospiraceae bacterium]
MKRDVLIHIKSLIDNGEEADKIEISTRGKAFEKDGVTYLSYKETDQNGFDGNSVLIKAESGCVTISRLGSAKSQLFVKPYQRNICSYATPYGTQTLGISGIYVSHKSVSDKKRELSLCYELDINHTFMSKNTLVITYEESAN